MEKNKILYVLNPISGRGIDREQVWEELNMALPGIDIQTIKTSGKGDMERISDALKKSQFQYLLIAGGDGTISLATQAIIASEVNIAAGIIPTGSANGLARCLGIENITMAIEAIKKGQTLPMDILEINNSICLHLSDFGFNAGLIKKFDQEDERGMMSYMKSSLLQFIEMKPYRFTLKINEEQATTQARMLVIANGDRYGTGAVINPGGKMNDGMMEIIAFNPQGLEAIASLSVDLFNEEINQSEFVNSWKGTRAEIINHDGADFQIDGESQGPTPKVTIQFRKEKIKFFSRV